MSNSAQASADLASARRIGRSLSWMKASAVSVPVLASTAMTCAVGALLPPVPSLVLFTLGFVVAWALLTARVEHLAMRLLYRGAPLSVADQRVLAPVVAALSPHGLGPPLIQIWARPGGLASDVTAAGRSSVLVNRSLIDAIRRGEVSRERATSLIAHAAGLARSGATRADPFLRFWTIPWVLLTRSMVALAGVVGVAVLVRVMWKARWVLTAVAAVQAVAASNPGLAVLVSTIGASSYLWSWGVRAWHARLGVIGAEAVARVHPAAPPAANVPAPRGPGTSPALGSESSRRRHLSVVH